MKKKLIMTAALIGALSFSMLTGFDNAATVEDVLSGYAQASQEQNNINATITGTVDAAASVENMMDLSVKADADLSLAATVDPIAIAETGSVSVDLAGDTMDLNIDMYMVTEDDGSFSMYQKTEVVGQGAPEWTKTTVDASQAQKAMDMVANNSVDFSKLPIEFSLASAPVMVGDTECYALTASDTVANLILKAQQLVSEMDAAAGEQLSSVISLTPLLSGVVCNVELDIACDTYTVQKMHFDLNGSDWSMIEQMLPILLGMAGEEPAQSPKITINVNAFAFDAVYDYATPVNVTVPEEALSAQSVSTDSLLELVENAG